MTTLNVVIFKMKESTFNHKDFHYVKQYEHFDKYLNNLIEEFVEFQYYECNDLYELFEKTFKNSQSYNDYFTGDEQYIQSIKIFENEKAEYIGYYCYSHDSKKTPKYNNFLGSIFSKDEEEVYSDFIILKNMMNNKKDKEITKEEIKEIIKSRLIFTGVYFDKVNNFIGSCEFYSSTIENIGCGAAGYLERENIKFKDIHLDENVLKIVYNIYEDNKPDIKEKSLCDVYLNKYKDENKKYYDFMDRFIKENVDNNVKKCVLVFYYHIHNHEFVWSLKLEEMCKMLKFYDDKKTEQFMELIVKQMEDNENENKEKTETEKQQEEMIKYYLNNREKNNNGNKEFNLYEEIKNIEI